MKRVSKAAKKTGKADVPTKIKQVVRNVKSSQVTAKVKSPVGKVVRPDAAVQLGAQLNAWSSGIASETNFWRDWIDTSGGQWPQDFIDRLKPDMPMSDNHAQIVRSLKKKTVDVLDVGAGPLTWLGKTVEGVTLKLRASDPLAEVYARLLDAKGVVPPIKTEFAPVEDLHLVYEPQSFDFIHIRNALDHSFEPLRGVMQMLRLCRPGGFVLLSHFVDEAERESYEGFHQWNFNAENGSFVIWNQKEKIRVSDHAGRYAKETTRVVPHASGSIGWIDVLFQRNSVAMPPSDINEVSQRAREVLKFFVLQNSKLVD